MPDPIHDALCRKVMKLSEHERCKTVYVVRPIQVTVPGDRAPSLQVQTLARIHVVRPPRGHAEGILKVGVQAWTFGDPLVEDGTMIPFYGEARGLGYDKLEAALRYAYIGGHTLGPAGGRLTLRALAEREGWTILGDLG